jgi:hypothetical protein
MVPVRKLSASTVLLIEVPRNNLLRLQTLRIAVSPADCLFDLEETIHGVLVVMLRPPE